MVQAIFLQVFCDLTRRYKDMSWLKGDGGQTPEVKRSR